MSSRHNTRARSRADRASSTTSGTTYSGQRGPYHEPASTDLPGLFPVHDGSYGLNTLVNVDAVRRRRGNRPRPAFVNEDEEDERFARGLDIEGLHYGMALQAGAVADDDENATDVQNQGTAQGNQSSVPGIQTAQDNPAQPGSVAKYEGDAGQQPQASGAPGGDDGGPVNDFDPVLAETAYIPIVEQPFGGHVQIGPPKPPFSTVQHRSPNPHSSFTGEGGLYSNASVHTPGKTPPSSGPVPTSNVTVPSSSEGIPSSNNPGGTTDGTIPTANGITPNTSGTVPTTSGTTPKTSGTTRTTSRGIPTTSGGIPTSSEGIPTSNNPSGTSNKAGQNGGNSSIFDQIPRPNGLTDQEWRNISRIIQLMRAAGPLSPSRPPPTLSGLSNREIEAIRSIVLHGHMSGEQAVYDMLLKALNDAAIPSRKANLSDEEIERRVNHLIHDMIQTPESPPPSNPTLADTYTILGASDAEDIRTLARDLADANSFINILRKHSQSRILFPKNAQYNEMMRRVHDVVHDMERPIRQPYKAPGIEYTHVILSVSDIQGIKAMVGDQGEANTIAMLLQRHPRSRIAFLKSGQPELSDEEIERRVHNVIHDMILPPEPPLGEHPPIELPPGLTAREIQAMRWLIPDMTDDKAYGQRIAEALDEAYRNLPPQTTNTILPSTKEQASSKNQPALGPSNALQAGPNMFADGIDDRGVVDGGYVPLDPDIPPPVPLRRRSPGPSWWSKTLVFFVMLGLVWAVLPALIRLGRSDVDDIFTTPGVQWPTFSGITGGLGRIIPSIPNPWVGLQPRRRSDGDANVVKAKKMKTDGPVGELIEDISKIIPSEVFVDRGKNGKIRISEDFWHALKDLIKNDEVILTLKNVRKAPEISEDHWKAVKARIENDSSLRPRSSDAASGAHGGVSWENWMKQNKDKLKEFLGNETPGNKKGSAISRKEFMKLFGEEIQSYQNDIRKEFATRDTQIKDLVDLVGRLRETAKSSGGMTEKQIRAICDQIVQRAIRKTKFDAVADGRIKGGARELFENNVNLFSVGSGAVVDPSITSKPWDVPTGYYKYKSKEWYQSNRYKAQSPQSALMPWFEEGQCFCAGPSKRGLREETNTISVLMSRFIVPQHLVVEHIPPRSTLNPGARPKDIEVWMYIEEVTLREEVRLWSQKQFPNTPEEKKLNEGFVKVGHFIYEDISHGDGTQIFKLSDDLATIGPMGAPSQNFVIRAISNYGADHTCFYRLRMYGDIADVRPWETDGK
ncbi:hypothetical protein F4818DRAFT_49976 [Hypoxylon cercidicola]|nr:hypothetical protein F4818DRAFT_49976 [Hypoxylon cercidicola]